MSCEIFSESHRGFFASVVSGTGPKTFAEEMKCSRWGETMRVEIEAQEKNKTWPTEFFSLWQAE